MTENSSNIDSSTSSFNDDGAYAVDTSVASAARDKYTSLDGSGDDTVTWSWNTTGPG